MNPDDLPLLNSVSAPTLHPDGDRAVVSVVRPDFDADAYVGQLWEVRIDGTGSPRRLTRGFRDSCPRFSPDGNVLAFLRAGAEDPAQLYIVDARGGEPQQVTDRKLGVSGFNWSPDSARIAFTARVPDNSRYGTVDGVGPGAEDPRLIDTLKFRMNGLGYIGDKRAQIFTITVPAVNGEPSAVPVGRAKEAAREGGRAAVRHETQAAAKVAARDAVLRDDASGQAGEVAADAAAGPTGKQEPEFSIVPAPEQITDADADHLDAVYSHDGTRILFAAALHQGRDRDLVSDVYAISAAPGVPTGGREIQRLTNLSGSPRLGASSGRISADGKWLFYLAAELSGTGVDFVARNTVLYAAPANNPAEARPLTDPETMDLGETAELVPAGPDAVLVHNRTRGSIELLMVGADGNIQVLLDGPRQVTGTDVAGEAVVAVVTDPTGTGDLYLIRPGADDVPDQAVPGQLTDFSAVLRERTAIAALREVTYAAADGYPVHGWVVLPEGQGPHPVLLNIHGGPFAQYGWGHFDEAQVYAAAGYAVLMCNPRGAAGYGQAHGRAIKEAMGTVDLQDVLGFVDGALAQYAQLDANRLGVMGGSYGGYLTAWTISQDHRFAAAIIERGYLDPPSFVGSSDIGWFFSAAYTGTEPDQIRAQNPFAHVDKVRTPALLIHSEQDLRCPLEQAHRYYTALKLRNIETELLIFPGENHELSRSGSPYHRKQRFEHILRWWARYLPTPGNFTDLHAGETTETRSGRDG